MFKKSFLLAGIAFMIVGCGNSENNNIVSVNTDGTTIVDNSNLSDTLNDYVIIDLNDTEEADLLVLREEEKLAHDVYIALYDLYHQNIFSNIAGAE
jgi:hypothetical protein